jgi:hypothetical protein
MTRRYSLLPLFVLFLVLVGCSKPNATPGGVTGKVTYNGAPVTAGNMNFYAKDGTTAFTTIDSSGNYEVALPAGDVVVTIDTKPFDKKAAQTYGKDRGGKQSPIGPIPDAAKGMVESQTGAYVKIPDKYANKDKSDLKFTVTTGKQVHNLELKD